MLYGLAGSSALTFRASPLVSCNEYPTLGIIYLPLFTSTHTLPAKSLSLPPSIPLTVSNNVSNDDISPWCIIMKLWASTLPVSLSSSILSPIFNHLAFKMLANAFCLSSFLPLTTELILLPNGEYNVSSSFSSPGLRTLMKSIIDTGNGTSAMPLLMLAKVFSVSTRIASVIFSSTTSTASNNVSISSFSGAYAAFIPLAPIHVRMRLPYLSVVNTSGNGGTFPSVIGGTVAPASRLVDLRLPLLSKLYTLSSHVLIP